MMNLQKSVQFIGTVCSGLLISLPAIPQVVMAQATTSKINPCPSIFYEEPHNNRILAPAGCPPNALTLKLMEVGIIPLPISPSSSLSSSGVDAEASSALNPNPTILNEPPYNRAERRLQTGDSTQTLPSSTPSSSVQSPQQGQNRSTMGEDSTQTLPSSTPSSSVQSPQQGQNRSTMGEDSTQTLPSSTPSSSVQSPQQGQNRSTMGENSTQTLPSSTPSSSVQSPQQGQNRSTMGENSTQTLPSSTPSSSVQSPQQGQDGTTRIALANGKANIRLMNETGAIITYQVIGDTAPRTLQGKSDITLQGLSAPVTITFQRQDAGLLMVTPKPGEEGGSLEVTLKETTNVNQDRSAMRIEPNGSVFFN
ncbi:hypothetical protein H6G06_10015 [Anabaena sphaerica FACHB-251]|uniref:Uncharacterized protein n=1 Tax=Anabaena sphaerica FACHB-251 TaxID=2692883 RepID=A0A926WFW1_9NOST|nr:hypothetical protein [Anabaena sphaerica FACHB-251]